MLLKGKLGIVAGKGDPSLLVKSLDNIAKACDVNVAVFDAEIVFSKSLNLYCRVRRFTADGEKENLTKFKAQLEDWVNEKNG